MSLLFQIPPPAADSTRDVRSLYKNVQPKCLDLKKKTKITSYLAIWYRFNAGVTELVDAWDLKGKRIDEGLLIEELVSQLVVTRGYGDKLGEERG